MAKIARRSFLSSTAGAVAASIVPASALGRGGKTAPSNRVAVGIIGTGGRGMYEGRSYVGFDNCEVVALCDVQETRRTQAKQVFEKLYAAQKPGYQGGIRTYNDFRELLSRKDIDAVYIATADHWHVPITVAACKAGKDCHTEKPLGVNIEHDLAALKAVRKHRRIFQYGAERRSTPEARHAIELVLNGRIGKVQQDLCCLARFRDRRFGDAGAPGSARVRLRLVAWPGPGGAVLSGSLPGDRTAQRHLPYSRLLDRLYRRLGGASPGSGPMVGGQLRPDDSGDL